LVLGKIISKRRRFTPVETMYADGVRTTDIHSVQKIYRLKSEKDKF